MPIQLYPASVMFLLIVIICTLFFVPATKLRLKPPLVHFYWAGFWALCAGLVAMAGAPSVLGFLGQETAQAADDALFGLSAAFVLFVVFGWFRLTLFAASGLFKKKASIPVEINS